MRQQQPSIAPPAGSSLLSAGDEALLAGISSHDVAALGELYDRYSVRAFHLARSICHDPQRAEDAVQDAFLSIWRSSGTYRSQRGSPTTWLMTVVRSRAIDLLRHDTARFGRNVADDELERVPSPDDVPAEVDRLLDAGDLHDLLSRLPAVQREAIAMAYFDGLTRAQIAGRLGLPCGTVKSRIRLGLGKLRELQAVPDFSDQRRSPLERIHP